MTKDEQDAFIAKVGPLAQASAAKFGVPASVTIAQAILESAWGESGLARQALNFFGIKARQGEEYSEFKTTEYVGGKPEIQPARFRKFRSLQECFNRHASLLACSKRYEAAMAYAGDPQKFCIQLQRCGYATDPNYPVKLAKLIERYDLERFDAKEKS